MESKTKSVHDTKSKMFPGFLPLITENRSLVSSSPRNPALSLEDQVLQWFNATKRRLQDKLLDNPGDESAVTFCILKKELVAVFIEVLQKRDHSSWRFLSEVLLHMKMYQKYLSIMSSEINHYLERIWNYIETHKEEFLGLNLAENLQLVFPEAVDRLKSQPNVKLKQNFIPLTSKKPTLYDKLPAPKLPSLTLPDGSNPYQKDFMINFRNPVQKLLTFGDLNTNMAEVALQASMREAVWNACLGTTALALSVQLPSEQSNQIEELVDCDISASAEDDSQNENEALEHEEKKLEAGVLLSGRAAVEHFAKCHHLGKLEFMYFNIAPNRHFRPYSVVEVLKNQVKREHYIFSTFGVLHVINGDHSEALSLAEWQRDAVLWEAASKIPFFRNYLLRKTFQRWRANIHFQHFAKMRHQVALSLLVSMPCYGAALQQVLRLCQELLLLNFLPLNKSKCYKLCEFELAVSSVQKCAKEILEKFFRYQKIITNTVQEELGKRINQYEDQPTKKLVVSKESHHVQKTKKIQRRKILQQLKYQTSFFGAFVKLVKKILLSYLVHLAEDNVSLFVKNFISLSSSREAYFTAALTFSPDSGLLALSPPKEKFSDFILKIFLDIPHFLTQSVISFGDENTVGLEPVGEDSTPPHLDRYFLKSNDIDSDAVKLCFASDVLDMDDDSTSVAPESNRDDVKEMETPLNISPTFDTLNESNLAEKLKNNESYQSSVKEEMKLMKLTLDDISEFLQKNAWLNDIYLFIKTWIKNESVQQWKSAPAYVIEQKLTEIKLWRERIHQFESTYATDNGLFLVDCSAVQETLLPKLNAIHQELCVFVNEQAVALAQKFCYEMKIIIQNMADKKTTVGEFAEYARNVKVYQRNLSNYQVQEEYIKSLFEVIRMAYRLLHPEEEKLEEEVMTYWNQFLVLLQEALEFVNLQTPLIIQSLDSMFKKLEEEAKEICAKATGGKFLDPDQNPTAILNEMSKLHDQFYSIHKQIHEACKWKELISGEPYDIRFLTAMALQMDARHEVWKYFEVALHSLCEWKATVFKKFDVKRAIAKVSEWETASNRMKQTLGEGDAVLAKWSTEVHEFQQHLPFLLKLSHPALKAKHWQQIFLMAGHEYETAYPYTVGDLIQLNLSSCSQAFDSILSAAIVESRVEQKLSALHNLWNEREFKLAKHLPESLLKADESLVGASVRRGSSGKLQHLRRQQSARYDSGSTKSLEISRDGLDILIEVDQLKYLLEDSRLTLQTMEASPFLAKQSGEINQWMASLAEVDELLDLWSNCQTQWLYLLKIFDNEDFCQKLRAETACFKTVHSSFLDFMAAVVADPLVMSILKKPRGDRHYRLHQGDRLKILLSSLIQKMEEILSSLSSFLEDARNQFPRLYFLSDHELVHLLAISRNPLAFLPFVHKCFYGVFDLSYELPIGMTLGSSSSSSLTYALHGSKQLSSSDLVYLDKLELVKLIGPLGDEVKLCKNVRPQLSATKWLANLEKAMKSTIQRSLEACVQCSLDNNAKQPIQLLEYLEKLSEMKIIAEDEATENVLSATHRLLNYPVQCILVTEAILWQRNVQHAFTKNDKDLLKSYCSDVSNNLNQYSKVLHELNHLPTDSKNKKYLHCLLGNLVCQSLHHQDIMNRLLERSDFSGDCFEWIKTLKYQMDVRSILNAKTSDFEKKDLVKNSTHSETVIQRKVETTSFKNVSHFDYGRTTVSTGYQFGPCLISQMNRTFAYDYEFFGATPRLVMTPLTERAQLMLSMAVGTFQCGTLTGPNGTGKSETIKDLAKAFGRHLITINCNSELSHMMITRYLTGLIHSGSWGIFDRCEKMSEGLLSVTAQHLDFLAQTFHVLSTTVGNQYGIRGQAGIDRPSERRVRRNSLTTLHSLPASVEDEELRSVKKIGLERQATVPHGFNEDGLLTYFEDPWVKEREQRGYFKRGAGNDGLSSKPLEQCHLLYEHVTLNRKPKMRFDQLQQPNYTYKPQFAGSLLFNGKLCRANVNYGCFMTLNMTEATFTKLPENLKASMRPCAMVTPGYKVITQVLLYRNGFQQHQTLAAKLVVFFELITVQLPKRQEYDFGLRTLLLVIRLATAWLSHRTQRRNSESERSCSAFSSVSQTASSPVENMTLCTKSNNDEHCKDEDVRSVSSVSSASSSLTSFLAASDSLAGEEDVIIQALISVLVPRMARSEDEYRFRSLLRDVFPSSVRQKPYKKLSAVTFVDTLSEKALCNNLSLSSSFVDKILQFYSCLQSRSGVILIGQSGCGKTTAYQLLAQTLNQIHEDFMQDEAFTLEKELRVDETKCEKAVLPQNQKRRNHLNAFLRGGLGDGSWNQHSANSAADNLVLNDMERIYSPKVDVDIIFPNVFTLEELFGGCHGSTWQTGLLGTIFKKAYSQAAASAQRRTTTADAKHSSCKWIVLDGDLNSEWSDMINGLIDDEGRVSFPNGETVTLHESTRLIFELANLSNASPCMIERCAMIHFADNTIGWTALTDTWSKSANERWIISSSSLQVLNGLVSSIFPSTVEFIEKELTFSAAAADCGFSHGSKNQGIAPGLVEVSSYLNIFSSLLDLHLSREKFKEKEQRQQQETEGSKDRNLSSQARAMSSTIHAENAIPNYQMKLKHLFIFAYIWGFGSRLKDCSLGKFDQFARTLLQKTLSSIVLPQSSESTLFDFGLDSKSCKFLKWNEISKEKPRIASQSFILVPELERYIFWVELFLGCHRPLLLTGDVGTGKSSLIQNILSGKPSTTTVVVSKNLSSSRFQHQIKFSLPDAFGSVKSTEHLSITISKRTKQKHILFIDDLNCAGYNNGVAGSLELLRQMLTQRALPDRKRQILISLTDIDILAAASNPGILGNGPSLNARLLRLFTTFNVFTPSEKALHSIYGHVIKTWLDEFPDELLSNKCALSQALVAGAIQMYSQTKMNFHPTPDHPYYIFTLHDLSRIFNGMMLLSPRSVRQVRLKADLSNGETHPNILKLLLKLWCHECSRVLGDRINGKEDSKLFLSLLEDTFSQTFFGAAPSQSMNPDLSLQDDSLSPPCGSCINEPASPSAQDAKEKGRWQSHASGVESQENSYLAKEGETEKLGYPLMHIQQVMDHGQSLRDIIFSKYILTSQHNSQSSEDARGYSESNPDRLAEALTSCLASFKSDRNLPQDMVFFTDAVRHITRLCRVLATPSGHVLLIANGFPTGRTTLVQLASILAKCQFYDLLLHMNGSDDELGMKALLRECSSSVGICGKPVIIFIPEKVSDCIMDDVCAFMKCGTCPGLYMEEEISKIAGLMMPGQLKTMSKRKIVKVFNQFLERVRKHVHFFICVQKHDSLQEKINIFPGLISATCHIDLYERWDHVALTSVAESWLKESKLKVHVPWDEQNQSEQIVLVAKAMAFIHQSAMVAADKQYMHQKLHYQLITPATYREFVHSFQLVAANIVIQKMEQMEKFDAGLNKVKEASAELECHRQNLEKMEKTYHDLTTRVANLASTINQLKKELSETQQICKQEEEMILLLTSSIKDIESRSLEKYGQVDPSYKAALDSLESLEQHSVEEVRSYRQPPERVQLVMDAVCLLFNVPSGWENAKLMLLRDKFFEDLVYFDKNNISAEVFEKLGAYIQNPLFTCEEIVKSSVAAANICQWVHAIYGYTRVSLDMKPLLKELQQSQSQLSTSQVNLGKKRMEVQRLKSALQQKILTYKEANMSAKELEKQLQAMEKSMEYSAHLLDSLATHQRNWKNKTKEAKSVLRSAVANSLLTAACITYYGPLNHQMRFNLIHEWLDRSLISDFSSELDLHMPENLRSVNSVHSQQAQINQGGTITTSSQGDDALAIHEMERGLSLASDASTGHGQLELLAQLASTEDPQNTDSSATASAASMSLKSTLGVSEDFSFQGVLSSWEETTQWEVEGLPLDPCSIENALILRAALFYSKHRWCLLVDPDGQAETWLPLLLASSKANQMKRNESDFMELLDKNKKVDLVPQISTGVPVYEAASGLDSNAIDEADIQGKRDLSVTSDADKNVNLLVPEVVERPKNNLWTISSEDPNLPSHLLTAVAHGIVVLITKAEKKSLPKELHSILFCQFLADSDQLPKVAIAGQIVTCHQNFRLFLSMSVPLDFKGDDGWKDNLVNHMSVIDLTLSQEGIINHLLREILAVDRPEFEVQKRSLVKDFQHHLNEMNDCQELIMNKVLTIGPAMLHDETMQEWLDECHTNIDRLRTILREIESLQELLEKKRVPYVPLARNCAKLYEIIGRMSILHPSYYMSFTDLVLLVMETVRTRYRGKGNIGAPEARARELTDVTTEVIYRRVSDMMFEPHVYVFALLASFEKLRLSNQLTNTELAFFVNGVDTSAVEDCAVCEDKPDWIPKKVWLDCAALESALSIYRHLRESFIKNSSEWEEYFRCPFDILNSWPGNWVRPVSVFQKCLLWRICVPDRLWEICWPLIVHEYGGIMQQPQNYSIHHIVKESSSFVPNILLLPSPRANWNHSLDSTYGLCFSHPMRELENLARESSREAQLHVVACGVPTQMTEIENALKDCMEIGHWLFLHNLHLCKNLTPDILQLMQNIESEREKSVAVSQSSKQLINQLHDGISDITQGRVVHKDFQLWITACIDHSSTLPDVLKQHGRIFTCEATNSFKSHLLSAYASAKMLLSRAKIKDITDNKIRSMTYQMALALFHSLIIHRQNYTSLTSNTFGRFCNWSVADLAAVIDGLNLITSNHASNNTNISELLQLIYSSRCLSASDGQWVYETAYSLLSTVNNPKEKVKCAFGVTSVLPLVLLTENEGFEKQLASLIEPHSDTLGLTPDVQAEFLTARSRYLMDDLVRVMGDPASLQTCFEKAYHSAGSILHNIQILLSHFPQMPPSNANVLYPLDLFLQSELDLFKDLLDTISSDVVKLLFVLKGQAAPSTCDIEALLEISCSKVPQRWQSTLFSSSADAIQWIGILERRLKLLLEYLPSETRPAVFHIGAFNRPDRFLQVVLLHSARQQFKSVHTSTLDIQVLAEGTDLSKQPGRGVYVEGFLLHNATWNKTISRLDEDTPTVQRRLAAAPAKMPVIWLRQKDNQSQQDLQGYYYNCPIFASDKTTQDSYIGSLTLSSNLKPNVCLSRQISLYCDFPK